MVFPAELRILSREIWVFGTLFIGVSEKAILTFASSICRLVGGIVSFWHSSRQRRMLRACGWRYPSFVSCFSSLGLFGTHNSCVRSELLSAKSPWNLGTSGWRKNNFGGFVLTQVGLARAALGWLCIMEINARNEKQHVAENIRQLEMANKTGIESKPKPKPKKSKYKLRDLKRRQSRIHKKWNKSRTGHHIW